MAVCSLVSVVIPEGHVAADFPEMQAVVPPARVLFIFRLPDGHIDDVAIFDILRLSDSGVERHPPTYVIKAIEIRLWALLHRFSGDPQLRD